MEGSAVNTMDAKYLHHKIDLDNPITIEAMNMLGNINDVIKNRYWQRRFSYEAKGQL